MAYYGLPYVGSKNTIASWVVDHLPEADDFYDLFAGGCSVSHAAIVSGKFKNIYANDIEETVKFFLDSVNGKYKDRIEWVSRDTFFRNREKDLYVRYCWSFLSNGLNYIYNILIEPYYRALHYLIFYNDNSEFKDLKIDVPLMEFDTADKRYTAWKNYCTKYPEVKKKIENLTKSVFRLRSLENTFRVNSLTELKPYMNSINFYDSRKDYRDVEIKENSIVYCDIPYENTFSYLVGEFNYKEFYDYVHKELVPKTKLVVISSYNVSDPNLVCIGRIKKLQNTNTRAKSIKRKEMFKDECLFIPVEQVEWYKNNCIKDWSGDL